MLSIKHDGARAVATGALASLLYVSGVAWAQVTADTAGPASKDPALEEITVTAQRRSEDIHNVPVAITAITPAELKNLDLVSVDSMQLVTPDLVYNTGYTFAQPFIRGVGTNLPDPGLEGAVASYVDGAYQDRSFGTVGDLFDVSSVQILKGPQGTLWGRNASGGAIVISTADPTNETSARFGAEYGRFNHVEGEAVFNAPITDTLAIRIAVRHTGRDGFITNLNGGPDLGEDKGDLVRVKLRWAPIEGFSAVLGYEYDRYAQSTALSIRGPQALCLPCVASGGLVQPVQGFYQTNEDHVGPIVSLSHIVNLRLRYDTDTFSVQSTTSLTDQSATGPSDQDFSPLNLESFNSWTGGKTVTQELLVSTQSAAVLNGLFGASYLEDKGHFNALIAGGAGTPFADLFTAFGAFPYTSNVINTHSASVFLEGYLTPVERLKITLGGRYTHDTRDFDLTDNLAGSAVGGSLGVLINQSASTSGSAFTPRVVIAYDLADVNLYASWNRGYKAGGFTTPDFVIVPQDTVKPEHIDSYEVGAKFLSEDRRVRVNAAAFYYVYKDIQVSIIENINGVATPFTTNAAGAKGNGLELDGSFALNRQLDLLAGAEYLHGYYTSFPAASVSVPSPTGGLASATEDLAGAPLPRAPRYTFYAGGTLRQPLGNNWQATLNAIAHYTSEYDFQPGRGGPIGFSYQPAFTLVNLTANIGPQNERYSLGVYVDNLANVQSYEYKQTTAPFGLAYTAAPPRTYGLRLSAKF